MQQPHRNFRRRWAKGYWIVGACMALACGQSWAESAYELYPIPDAYAGIGQAPGEVGTEVGFVFYGDLAQALYDRMPAAPTVDICTGGSKKTDRNGVNCVLDPEGNASCSFGYNLDTGALNQGPLVC